ncbi:kinase-like domain-containing protein [Nemania serpens]|nr:kinase-like domain-containing protein [Nemania serpens]
MSLYSQLYNHLCECSLGGQVLYFLPLNSLDELITTDSVEAQLSLSDRLPWSRLPGEVVQHAKKVFAILVLIDKPRAIKKLLREGLTDEHLPLFPKGDGSDNILVSARGKIFQSFATWHNSAKVAVFLEKQWVVQAPVLDATDSDITLNPKCVLPFYNIVELGEGQSSRVYKGELHPAHQKGLKAAQLLVAIKDVWDRRSFEGDVELTRYHHPHLMKPIAACQTGLHYYIIFPWPDGEDLWEFWRHGNSRQRTPDLILWSLQQMLGLADALETLHKRRLYHGDLNPACIFHLNKGGKGALVIVDSDVSRARTKRTGIRNRPTLTLANSALYESPDMYTAPEVYATPSLRLRKPDIWSLGCIFLEFTIWLLYDFRFTALVSLHHSSNGSDNRFYQLTSSGAAIIHPAVSAAIDALRKDPRCKGGTALEDLVNLIADSLLQIKVLHRVSATKVCDGLQKIVRGAENNPSYLLNIVDPFLPTLPNLQDASDSVASSGSIAGSGYQLGPLDKQPGVNEAIQGKIESRIETLPADSESSSSPTDYRHGSSRSPSDKPASSVTSSYGDSRHLTSSSPASKHELLLSPPTTSARAALPVPTLETVNEDPDTAKEQHPSDLSEQRETIGGGVDISDANFEDYTSKADTAASKMGSCSEMFAEWLRRFIQKTLENIPLSGALEALSPMVLQEFAIRLGHEGL